MIAVQHSTVRIGEGKIARELGERKLGTGGR